MKRGFDGDTGSKTIEMRQFDDIVLSPAHTHKNMSLFFLSRALPKDGPEIMTLEEGLTQKKVIISEKEDAEVRTLQLENQSDTHLFIQIGDIIKGGRQDRTIRISILVKPHSGKIDVPSLCVEHSRWGGGTHFMECSNSISPGKKIKMAMHKNSQHDVWDEVDCYKKTTKSHMRDRTRSRTSSIAEEMDNVEFKKLYAEYEQYFSEQSGKYPDAVGVAFALNGEINTIDLFKDSRLFAKVFHRTLKSYANESAITPTKKKTAKLTDKKVADFINSMSKGEGVQEKVQDNEITHIENEEGVAFELKSPEGDTIHRQYIKEDAPKKSSGRDQTI